MFISPGSRARPRASVLAETVESLIPCGRLTLTSNTPITSTDVTGATILYYTPYNGATVALFNGVNWLLVPFVQISASLSGLSASTVYDVFGVMNSSGSIKLEFVAWTNDTTRAVAISIQNGIDVKSTDPRRRLLGTIRTTTSAGTTEDSIARRFISNRYNDVPRTMSVTDPTATWVYSTATWRQANANTANQLDFVCCVARPTWAIVNGCLVSTSSAGAGAAVGVGLDTIPAVSNATLYQQASIPPTITGNSYNPTALYIGTPGAGRHFIAWIEYGNSSGTQTWIGTSPPTVLSGIAGAVNN